MGFALMILQAVISAGCSTPTYHPAIVHFQYPEGTDESQSVLDRAHCGAINRQVELEYQDLYYACMNKKGYKLITDTPAGEY